VQGEPFGDSHRFGAQVRQLQSDTFFKPRSTRLEYLFQSEESPWRNFLDGFFISKSFFAFPAINASEPWQGQVPALDLFQCNDLPEDRENLEYDLGRFLAMTTLLGITDLHFENCLFIIQDARFSFVALDLEIAFWNCVSGMDTLLFPSLQINRRSSGFSGQFGEKFIWNEPSRAMDGFLSGAREIQKQLHDLLLDLERQLVGHPNRVLLRFTKDYVHPRPRQDEMGQFLPSELLQINAGDIPYFFTFREINPRLLYFSAPGEISEQKIDNLAVAKRFNNAVFTCAGLSEKTRIDQLIRTTALHFAYAYPEFQKSKLEGEHFTLKVTDEKPGQLELTTSEFRVAARLP